MQAENTGWNTYLAGHAVVVEAVGSVLVKQLFQKLEEAKSPQLVLFANFLRWAILFYQWCNTNSRLSTPAQWHLQVRMGCFHGSWSWALWATGYEDGRPAD